MWLCSWSVSLSLYKLGWKPLYASSSRPFAFCIDSHRSRTSLRRLVFSQPPGHPFLTYCRQFGILVAVHLFPLVLAAGVNTSFNHLRKGELAAIGTLHLSPGGQRHSLASCVRLCLTCRAWTGVNKHSAGFFIPKAIACSVSKLICSKCTCQFMPIIGFAVSKPRLFNKR